MAVNKFVTLKDLYPKENSQSRLDFIKYYDRTSMLILLSKINCNYPKDPIHNTYSRKEQKEILRLFPLALKTRKKIQKKMKVTVCSIFTRTANLVAMEEIRNSPILNGRKTRITKSAFFKYYLAINSYLKQMADNVNNNTNFSNLEKVVARNAPINEYQLSAYPIEDIYRNMSLVDFINTSQYSNPFNSYIDSFSPKLTSKEYVKWLFNTVMLITKLKKENNVPICSPESSNEYDLVERFSSVDSSLCLEKPLLEVFSIRKYPFHKIKTQEYLVLDTMFIVDKCYHSLVWDFFFETLKPQEVRIADFRSLLGGWFEEYINNLLACLKPSPLPQLTVNGREFADLFIHHDNNIIVGQAKISAMNSNDKYDEDEIKNFFKNGNKEFYKEFGLKQMVENTLRYLVEDPKSFNIHMSQDVEYVIHPMLIFNERILQTLGMNRIFQEKFLEMIKTQYPHSKVMDNGEFTDIIIGNIKIRPLILAYIGDIELISIQLNCEQNPTIWSILEYYIQKVRQNYNTQLASVIKINYCYMNHLQTVIRPVMQ